MDLVHERIERIRSSLMKGCKDGRVQRALTDYAARIRTFSKEQVLVEIASILEIPSPFIQEYEDMLDPIEIKKEGEQAVPLDRFTCDRCGRCCETHVIGVSIHDVKNFIEHGLEHVLGLVILSEDRPYLRLLSKKEYKEISHLLSREMQDAVAMLNPSVELASTDDGSCVLYDSRGKRCSIHEWKPLECKIYPGGYLFFPCGDLECAPSCFSDGLPLATPELVSWLTTKRAHDHAVTMLYMLDVETNGWKLDFFKLGLLLARVASGPGD